MKLKIGRCNYQNLDGWYCDQPSGRSGLCYWHDPLIDKSNDDIKDDIEEWATTGRPLDGFQLARTYLVDLNLVNKGNQFGFSCRNADFYRADLSQAHFFRLDLRGSSLMKCKLVCANLHCAKLDNCNLLGADLSRARLENIHWGKGLKQEREVLVNLNKNDENLISLYQEAEEVCRNIRKQCDKQGLFETAGSFFQKEMRFRRYQTPLISARRAISKLVDIFCGYGESPAKVILFSLFLIMSCSVAYFILGTAAIENLSHSHIENSWERYAFEFLNAIYFSVVTFTTLGYGDIYPVGIAKLVATLEAFIGNFTMALFVVVFVKK
ncbi:ion channel [Candidatus Photodesmus anomalopis]|uniref:Ion channel n=2 Tax=Candidatus Photodesmus anomalopis TaxID=28176 RepID=S3EGS1_9GAMM|nr:ion channel [Candidatus Photodesmus katoptron]EPE37353.1 ion channel [Candidatus Photodesmus katoptron Akat1]